MKPKVGDMVRFKPAEVVEVFRDGSKFATKGSLWYANDLIEEILPRPFAVGDSVHTTIYSEGAFRVGNIVAVSGDAAWIKWKRGHPDTIVHFSLLHHGENK